MSDSPPIERFRFLDRPAEMPRALDVCVVHVPSDAVSREGLLGSLAVRLSLPGWFGGNWDALLDSLCDLHWIPQRRVVLMHERVPGLPGPDLRAYLEVLGDAIACWKEYEQHALEAVFATGDRLALARCLEDAPPA